MIVFIDEHRGGFVVGPICRLPWIAPSTHYAHNAVERDPGLASDRTQRDSLDMAAIKRVLYANRGRYGNRKLWLVLRRQGRDIVSCTVERLMLAMHIRCVVLGKNVITSDPDAAQPCPDDKGSRAFFVATPNRLLFSESTYASSWQGMS